MGKLNLIDWIAIILVLIGALNWGLVGIFNFNLVSAILKDRSILATVLYGLIGVSSIYVAVILNKLTKA
ncbi:MAG: DUF378 domain-containing protein [bacterium]